MTFDQFMPQMNRLVTTFGKNAYGEERVKLIYRTVKDFDLGWWSKTVDDFIGYFRQPPLLTEVAEKASAERERRWADEKKQHAQDAKDFWEGTYHSDEIKGICMTIRSRIEGRVNDHDWGKFMNLLNAQARRGNPPPRGYVA